MNKCVLGLEACMFTELKLEFKFLRQGSFRTLPFLCTKNVDKTRMRVSVYLKENIIVSLIFVFYGKL